MAEPAENKQPSFAIGTDFAQRHNRSAKLACIEKRFLIWPQNRTRTRVDDQGGTVAYSIISARRVWVKAFKSFPLGFLVREVHGPLDLCVCGRDLLDDLAVLVVTVQTKPNRLAFDSSFRITITAGRARMHSGLLGSNEESYGAITETGDADGWMNLDRSDCSHGGVSVLWIERRSVRLNVSSFAIMV